MAKRAHYKTRTIVRTIPAPRPIVRYRHSAKKKHHRGRRGQSSTKLLTGLVLGGLVLGFVDKPGGPLAAIPTIPVLGRAGTIAAAAHFLAKGKPGVVTDIRNAAAAIAAYEMGNKGSISGEGLETAV